MRGVLADGFSVCQILLVLLFLLNAWVCKCKLGYHKLLCIKKEWRFEGHRRNTAVSHVREDRKGKRQGDRFWRHDVSGVLDDVSSRLNPSCVSPAG